MKNPEIKCLEKNKNGEIAYQILWDALKAGLYGGFIGMRTIGKSNS